MGDTKPASNIREVRRLLRYGDGGMPVDDKQEMEPAETGDNVLDYAVAERAKLGIAGEIAEGQHRDRWPIRRAGRGG